METDNAYITKTKSVIDCPNTAELWRQIELWLSTVINRNINIAGKEKNISKNTNQSLNAFIVNMTLLQREKYENFDI